MLRALRDGFKHTSIYTVGNLTNKAVGFLMIPIYTHFLSPREYGIMDMLDLTIVLVGMLVGMGIGTAVFRFYYSSNDDKERREVIGSALLFNTLVAGVVGLVIIVASKQASEILFRASGYAFYIQLAILAFWVGTIGDVCRTYLRVQERSVLYVVASIGQLLVGLSLNIYFIAFRHMGVLGFLLSTLISNLLASVILLARTVSEIGFSFSVFKVRQMLGYGMPFVLSGLGLFILNFADRYFLNAYAGLSAVGVYALGYKFGFMINVLVVAPFLQMWQAQMFVVEKEANAPAIYVRMFEYFAALIVFAVLGVSIFIKDILRVMAGPEYFSAYQIVPIVALAYVFNGWAQYFRLGMLLTRRTGPIAAIMTGTGILTLVLYVVLIHAFHAMGAAVATLISFGVMMVWTYVASQRLFPVPYDLRRIAAVLGIAGLCYAVSWAADSTLGTFHLLGVIVRAATLAAYPLTLIYTGFFASEGIRHLGELPAGIRRIARGGEVAEP
ncbi:MAG TPA: oligosaccharide flippase family protein [Candidatus Dormibacteraeota bacterium]|nr:oligosaccharide flippase family protein [Candidatus Dormibacteraeota bacterium]